MFVFTQLSTVVDLFLQLTVLCLHPRVYQQALMVKPALFPV